jgi:hypothetical protein
MVAMFFLPNPFSVTYLNESEFVAEQYSRSFILKDFCLSFEAEVQAHARPATSPV